MLEVNFLAVKAKKKKSVTKFIVPVGFKRKVAQVMHSYPYVD